VLIASTSEVYGKGHKFPFSEGDDVLLGPTNKSRWGYAASKMLDEFLGLAYYHEYGLEVVCFRLFNTVGPRQSGQYGMVVPRFVRKALAGEPIEVYGSGSQQRCFGHVSDVVQGIEKLAFEKKATGNVFNIGSTQEISILELAEKVKKMTGSRSAIIHIPYEKAYSPGFEDMDRRVPDITKINLLTGWKATRDINDILSDVISFEKGQIG
jgi:UDP-glucose 4-epimerase